MAKSKTKHLSYISFPSQIIPALSYSTFQSLVVSPKKLLSSSASSRFRINRIVSSSPRILLLLLALAFLGTLRLGPVIPFSPIPCAQDGVRSSSSSSSFPAEGEFWRQPDGMGYRPCLSFSEEYRGEPPEGRRKYLLVVVAGGLNQQRNQIVSAIVIARILGAIVIARILGAAFVVPILQVNVVWGDKSGQFFQDIRSQLENDFMKSLQAEVTDDYEAEAIRPLSWYPGNVAWHLNFSRMQLRKNQALERFHEFLKQENEIGNITRQEAISMVPPLFLDVLPDHHILDTFLGKW
ncbi:uncharacterized protein LOC109716421 isoform X2 [Ananas comosus]|uniref:O-fucosyltransferase family protein n=1 Tax=Ananas comosus TaxID=4615 RepID=A0A6P5FVC6_ANACO|nr:uncharacterized protein LOC109716421 isoform X2 [Ananas comosus]